MGILPFRGLVADVIYTKILIGHLSSTSVYIYIFDLGKTQISMGLFWPIELTLSALWGLLVVMQVCRTFTLIKKDNHSKKHARMKKRFSHYHILPRPMSGNVDKIFIDKLLQVSLTLHFVINS